MIYSQFVDRTRLDRNIKMLPFRSPPTKKRVWFTHIKLVNLCVSHYQETCCEQSLGLVLQLSLFADVIWLLLQLILALWGMKHGALITLQ